MILAQLRSRKYVRIINNTPALEDFRGKIIKQSASACIRHLKEPAQAWLAGIDIKRGLKKITTKFFEFMAWMKRSGISKKLRV